MRLLSLCLPCLLLALPACSEREDEAGFERLRRRAFALHDAGRDPQAALEALRSAHRARPEAYGVNLRLGRLYADLRLHGEALSHLEQALAARPEEATTRLHVVNLLRRLGRYERALQLLPELLQAPGLRGQALHHQASVLDALGRRDEALAVLRQAHVLPPALGWRCAALEGQMLLEQGNLDDARARFERALTGRPDAREALKGLADCAHRQGREEDAAHHDRILELFLELRDNVVRRPVERRRELLQALTREHPRWQEGFRDLADLCLAQGDAAGACQAIEAFFTAHGHLLEDREREALRGKYCP